MKHLKSKLSFLFYTVPVFAVLSQNPIISTNFTADPAPMISNDTLYIFVGRDQEEAPKNSYLMREYRVYSTVDMVNWQDHGPVLKTSEISWSVNDASAAQCIEKDGKYYFYISTLNNTPGQGGVSVGVMVADNIYGPYKDVTGKALVTNQMTTGAKHSWDDLDPTIFIDDDGQGYLYWGNGACYMAMLNDDMISLKGAIIHYPAKDIDMFGPGFTEAPWVYKRNGQYYMIYASGFPESIHYSTAMSPTGPWKYQGVVMPLEGGSNTNHPGIIDYKGNSYFFYHNDALPDGHSYCRSVCVEPFSYNSDGTIPEMKMSEGVIKAITTLNPYLKTEAENHAFSQGIKSDGNKNNGIYLTSVHDGDYIKIRNVDFGKKGATKFTVSSSSRYFGGDIELRLDSINGINPGTLNTAYTGEWDKWHQFSTDIDKIEGVHDLYMIFKGRKPHELMNLDYWYFSE